MKKACFILFVTLTSFQLTSQAQDVRVGVSAGLTVSDIAGSSGMNHSVKTGFMAGLLIDMPLGSRFTFQPQLNYVQKGNLESEDANEKVYNALRYVEIPFNFLYNINTGRTIFYLGARPSIAFNVPSKRVTKPVEGDSFYSDILFGETPENDFRGIDWGVNMLAAIKFADRVTLSGFYNMGLRDLNTKINATESVKNKVFGVQVAYIFKNK